MDTEEKKVSSILDYLNYLYDNFQEYKYCAIGELAKNKGFYQYIKVTLLIKKKGILKCRKKGSDHGFEYKYDSIKPTMYMARKIYQEVRNFNSVELNQKHLKKKKNAVLQVLNNYYESINNNPFFDYNKKLLSDYGVVGVKRFLLNNGVIVSERVRHNEKEKRKYSWVSNKPIIDIVDDLIKEGKVRIRKNAESKIKKEIITTFDFTKTNPKTQKEEPTKKHNMNRSCTKNNKSNVDQLKREIEELREQIRVKQLKIKEEEEKGKITISLFWGLFKIKAKQYNK